MRRLSVLPTAALRKLSNFGGAVSPSQGKDGGGNSSKCQRSSTRSSSARRRDGQKTKFCFNYGFSLGNNSVNVLIVPFG